MGKAKAPGTRGHASHAIEGPDERGGSGEENKESWTPRLLASGPGLAADVGGLGFLRAPTNPGSGSQKGYQGFGGINVSVAWTVTSVGAHLPLGAVKWRRGHAGVVPQSLLNFRGPFQPLIPIISMWGSVSPWAR